MTDWLTPSEPERHGQTNTVNIYLHLQRDPNITLPDRDQKITKNWVGLGECEWGTEATGSSRSHSGRGNESQRNISQRYEGTALQKSPKSISIVSRARAWKSPFPLTPALDGLCAGAALVWGELFECDLCASGAGDPLGFGVVDLSTDKKGQADHQILSHIVQGRRRGQ